MYFLSIPSFPKDVNNIIDHPENSHQHHSSSILDIQSICDISFFKRTSAENLEIYQHLLNEAASLLCPVVNIVNTESPDELELIVAYTYGSTSLYFIYSYIKLVQSFV